VFGLVYGGFGVWEARGGLNFENLLFIIGGLMFMINGIYTWFRGEPQILE
jgi:sulfite exporter TauE/SafE